MEMQELKLPKPGEKTEEFEVLDEGQIVDTPEENVDIDIEVVDDTPPEDRGRKPSEPPEDVTDEELKEYSEKVAKRIKRFSKGYHDERRAKEEALRQAQELERFAKQLVEENKRLKQSQDLAHSTMLDTGKKLVETELAEAKRKYKEAYDAGDSDALIEAQEALNRAQLRAERLASFKPKALQPTETPVKDEPKQPQVPQIGPKERAWAAKNTWFGRNTGMTAYAIGVHTELTKELGIDPTSDEYYEKLDSRMREKFPEAFDEQYSIDGEGDEGKPRRATVVAPATRSTAPKKVVLTKTQVEAAKRLGVPLEEYAKQVALLRRKS